MRLPIPKNFYEQNEVLANLPTHSKFSLSKFEAHTLLLATPMGPCLQFAKKKFTCANSALNTTKFGRSAVAEQFSKTPFCQNLNGLESSFVFQNSPVASRHAQPASDNNPRMKPSSNLHSIFITIFLLFAPNLANTNPKNSVFKLFKTGHVKQYYPIRLLFPKKQKHKYSPSARNPTG